MKKFLLILFPFAFFSPFSFSQNLVPNPSFEQFDTCPNNDNDHVIDYSDYWYNPTLYASPDYFNSCDTTFFYGVPNNLYGNKYAKDGIAYAGIVTYNTPTPNLREYISVALNDTLKTGKKYCVSFYVSLGDSSRYAANNIGVYFSDTAVILLSDTVLPFTPQINNNPISNPLINKNGWTEVSDSFIASGEEKYLTIGNFNDDATTAVTNMTGASWCSWAMYVIDNVSVVLCDTLDDYSEQKMSKRKISIYPKISDRIYIVDLNESIIVNNVIIQNAFGRKVNYKINKNSANNIIIDLQDVDSGVYIITIQTNQSFFTEKIIKIN